MSRHMSFSSMWTAKTVWEELRQGEGCEKLLVFLIFSLTKSDCFPFPGKPVA